MEDFHRALSSRRVTIASIPDKGRGLVTTRDFAPGMVRALMCNLRITWHITKGIQTVELIDDIR
jgi:hypothetical protein